MSKYHGLTGSMSLCFSCLNIENEKCPKFKTSSDKTFDAKEFHDICSMFGGVSVSDCSAYIVDKNKLPFFALEALAKIEECDEKVKNHEL